MDDKNLQCPCMPQCPNYGKCRQCIAAHAEYYTVPHCIKKMQEDMKRNHLHPSNPHMRKTLTQRIEEFYGQNPNAHLRTAAETLKITQWQLLDGMPWAVSVPVADFDAVYGRLQELERVMLHLDTGSVVLQVTTRLPQAVDRQGIRIISRESGDLSLTSLLFAQTFYAIFLVRERLCGGKESLSVAFVNEEEKIALSVYLCRSDENVIEAGSKALFEALWEKYNKQKGE